MTLDELNNANEIDSSRSLRHCCAATKWISGMLRLRPFTSIEGVLLASENTWLSMQEEDLLEAFDAHPMIGDLDSLREKYRSTLATASHEQSGTQHASDDELMLLRDLNHQYVQQNGFIFIICASGLSATQMLNALKKRINNSREVEVDNAADQQLKITQLRLKKLLTNTTGAVSN